jgi:hypothetical protein
VKQGSNTFEISIPAHGDCAFIEMFIKGTDSDFPFRKKPTLAQAEATIVLHDLLGRRITRKTIQGYSTAIDTYGLFRETGTLASKIYIMELIIHDKSTARQTRSVRKIMLR